MLRSSVLLMVLTGLSSTLTGAEPVIGQHNQGVPELAVLEQFSGHWESDLNNSVEVIQGTRHWVLGGHFQQHDYSLLSGNLSGTMYRGYDSKNGRYTMLMIDSKGTASMLAGHWNESQKTLSLEAIDRSCLVQKYESYFPDDNTEKWTLTIVGDGEVVLSGTAKRQGANP